MTKSQAKQVKMMETMYKLGGYEINIAQGMSALVRSATNPKTAWEIRLIARSWGIENHPSFIL
jgi:hypothetical protein